MTRTISMYTSYSFRTKDPVIYEAKTMFQDSGKSYTDIAQASGLSISTIAAWFDGKTRRPQSASIEAFGRALGFKRKWVRYKEGDS